MTSSPPQGQQDNLDYNSALIDASTHINVTHNPNLAEITLHQLDLPADRLAGIEVGLFVSSPASVRIFNQDGYLLVDDAHSSTIPLSSVHDGTFLYTFGGSNTIGTTCSALAALATGDLDIYVEGLAANADVGIAYTYSGTDAYGNDTSGGTSVHMTVAKITLVDVNGNTVAGAPGVVTDQDVNDAMSSDPSTAHTAMRNIQAAEYKMLVYGLTADQASGICVADGTPAISFTSIAGGIETSSFIVKYDPDSASADAASDCAAMQTTAPRRRRYPCQ